eukprot:1507648-Amphidinium_carterae.1
MSRRLTASVPEQSPCSKTVCVAHNGHKTSDCMDSQLHLPYLCANWDDTRSKTDLYQFRIHKFGSPHSMIREGRQTGFKRHRVESI